MKRLFCVLLAVLMCIDLLQLRVSADGEQPAHMYSSALLEASTRMLIGGQDPETVLPVGTLTKLMTVYLAAEAVHEGRLTLNEPVKISPKAERIPGATVWLTAGEEITVRELLMAVIIGNANDAAAALACRLSGDEAAFVMEMNAAAFTLGMRHTRFADCTGISDENRSTAREIGMLCCVLLEYDFLVPFLSAWRDHIRDGKTELVNENRLTRTYEGILGMKAGHGDASGYTLALAAERDGMRFVSVILGCDGTDERFTYAKNLLSQGFSGFTVTTPDLSAEFMRPVPVRGGTENAVLAETDALYAAAVPKGKRVSAVVILPKCIAAPVEAGQAIGTAAFYCGDSLLYETALIAADPVPKRGFSEALTMLLAKLCK
ncbi:MAG: D-alanyl-D-alanine carboxypeptidase [Oscillospiraceae bacterium]|nr:D-alanyl-D-alanine carboxypeptidase [Oscillospiraceae bacterium]